MHAHPPIMQCLIFGYAASYDLNDVPYAVLDQDHTAASQELLSRLDGTGVFHRVANLRRARDIKTFIDDRRAVLVVQIDRETESGGCWAARRPTSRVTDDGRDWNAAAVAMGYVNSIVLQFNADWRGRARPGESTNPDQRAVLVQPEPRNPLEHDPSPDRHAHNAANAAAHGDVGGPRTQAGKLRSTARDAVPPDPDHRRAKPCASLLIGATQATTILLVAQLMSHPLRRLRSDPSRQARPVPVGGGRRRPVRLVAHQHNAAGDAVFVHDHDAVLVALGPDDADEQHARGDAILHADQPTALRDRHRPASLPRKNAATLDRLPADLSGPLAIIAVVTLSAASWMFRHRLT